MAKRKQAKKTTTTRRRRRARVGAIGGAGIQNILMPIAGAFAANFLGSQLLKKQSPTVQAAAPVVAGVLLTKFAKGPAVAGLATGMIAMGGAKLIQQFMPQTVAGLRLLPASDAVSGMLPAGSAVSGMPAAMKYGKKDLAAASYF